MRDERKTIEGEVDRVLEGLRRAEPDAGFEQRLKKALKQKLEERERRGRVGSTQGPGWRVALAGLVGGVVVLAFALSSARTPKRPAAEPRLPVPSDQVAHGRSSSPGTEIIDKGTSQPEKLHAARTGYGDTLGREAAVAHTVETIPAAQPASFPAPPMPLTNQERLLLRIANRSGPEELALLNITEQESDDAEETAGFEGFFGRPEPLSQVQPIVNEGGSR